MAGWQCSWKGTQEGYAQEVEGRHEKCHWCRRWSVTTDFQTSILTPSLFASFLLSESTCILLALPVAGLRWTSILLWSVVAGSAASSCVRLPNCEVARLRWSATKCRVVSALEVAFGLNPEPIRTMMRENYKVKIKMEYHVDTERTARP